MSGSTVRKVWSPPPSFRTGAMIGDYRVERVLAVGGMSTVYEAVHAGLGKRFALKVLHHDLCGQEDAVARFVQEARVVTRIGHPNIVDVVAHGTTDHGRVFLAMELLHGESLRERFARELPLAEACHILIEITHALEAAHAAGIIHRDLKPDNIFLTTQKVGFPSVKLLDFGIAKLTAATTGTRASEYDLAPRTQDGFVIGTPCYMSPEQAKRQQLDARTDIYSLGVVAFEMFTGRPPFDGKSGVDYIAKHMKLRPPAPTEIKMGLPSLVDELVGGLLEKERELRPSLRRARELLSEIPNAAPSNTAAALASSREQATRKLGTATPRRGRPMWIVAAVLAIGVSIAGLSVAMRDDDAKPTPAPPAQDFATPAPSQGSHAVDCMQWPTDEACNVAN